MRSSSHGQIPAAKLRELIHMGEFIQSHATHFFFRAAPDLFLGPTSDPGMRSITLVGPEGEELSRLQRP